LNGQPAAEDQLVPVAVTRVLDDNAALPESVNMKSALPEIAGQMRQSNQAKVFNHSLASRAPFNRQRMSIWAEALDRTAYDDGGPGYLFIVATGNIDGAVSPSEAQLETLLARPGHPRYLTDERCRLRNPAHAINALTVGAYVPRAGAPFAQRQNLNRRPIAQNSAPSPFTRT
jgi:Subtilase family